MTDSRDIAVDLAFNVRHIGGYHTPHGRPTSDRLIRAGSLAKVTEAGIVTLRDTGVRTIIDFRSGAEREKAPSPDMTWAGIAVVAAPVFEEEANPAGLPSAYTGHADLYRMFLDSGRNAYRTLIEAVAECEGGVLFHCAAGKDRTGVAAALLLGIAGVHADDIANDYSGSYERLLPQMAEWEESMKARGLAVDHITNLLASPAEAMHDTLAHIEETWGGAEGYFDAIGVPSGVVASARLRVLH